MIGAIAGSIAEATYGVPERIKDDAIDRLDKPLKSIVEKWEKFLPHTKGMLII